MDEDDYRDLIRRTEAQLISVGAREVADERHYVQDDGEGGVRLLPPEKHLIFMLIAFERFLAVRDGSVLKSALDRIEVVVGRRIENVVIERLTDDLIRDDVDLMMAPNFSVLRRSLRALVLNLQLRGGTPVG